MHPIRVAVVDESALLRGLLAAAVNRQPDMLCIGSARDALAARELLRAGADVLTLDASLSRMDGLELLSRLVRLHPVRVVMVVPAGEHGTEIARKAREMGALDVRRRPAAQGAAGTHSLVDDIVEAIRRLGAPPLPSGRPALRTAAPHARAGSARATGRGRTLVPA